mmetsp:Transcript_13389/g.15021  ORF Transcript_13389/g.15021 Transcript_13389/m.15021 type:complete len:280 (+) Transcript_13389:164-1003(+)
MAVLLLGLLDGALHPPNAAGSAGRLLLLAITTPTSIHVGTTSLGLASHASQSSLGLDQGNVKGLKQRASAELCELIFGFQGFDALAAIAHAGLLQALLLGLISLDRALHFSQSEAGQAQSFILLLLGGGHDTTHQILDVTAVLVDEVLQERNAAVSVGIDRFLQFSLALNRGLEFRQRLAVHLVALPLLHVLLVVSVRERSVAQNLEETEGSVHVQLGTLFVQVRVHDALGLHVRGGHRLPGQLIDGLSLVLVLGPVGIEEERGLFRERFVASRVEDIN